MRINLFGDTARSIEIPEPIGTGEIPIPADDRLHQRATHAALDDLEARFNTEGVTKSHYWDMIKDLFQIKSRTELSTEHYARLSATLNCCRRDPTTFKALVRKIKAHREKQQPPRQPQLTDATPVLFADPEDMVTDTCFVLRLSRENSEPMLIYFGPFDATIEERCQRQADTSRCIVQLFHNGNPPVAFFPSREGTRSPL